MRNNANISVLLLYIIVAAALRAVGFFFSVLDHDESTYMIIGRDILNGKVLYHDVIDSKSPGIFLIYAFLEFVGGHSIVFKRVFATIIVGITAFCLNVVSRRLFHDNRTALAAGFIYITFTSMWNRIGLSPNTEIYFNLFTILGLMCLLRRTNVRCLVAGLLLGTGFIIKNVVLLDFVALAGFFFVYDLIVTHNRRFTIRQIIPYAMAGLGFAVPFLFVNLYYYVSGYFEEFSYIAYELPGRYFVQSSAKRYIIMLASFMLRFLPLTLPFFYVLFSGSRLFTGWRKHMLLVWMGAVMIAIYLPGRGFSHYAIQLVLPMSIVAGLAFHNDFVFDRYTRLLYRGKSGLVLMITAVAGFLTASIIIMADKPDKPRLVAEYLEREMDEGDIIYTANYEHVIYYLLETESPTKYIHSSIFKQPELCYAFDIDPEEEIAVVIDWKPRFIVVRPPAETIHEMMDDDYELDTVFYEGEIEIYERIDDHPLPDSVDMDTGMVPVPEDKVSKRLSLIKHKRH